MGTGRLASLCGRYHAMDRDKRWERTRRAYAALVQGEGRQTTDARALLQQSYGQGITDEFLEPAVLVDEDGGPLAPIREDDSVVCFNFRADRVRQLTRALAFREFDGFDRVVHPTVHYTCMTVYDATFELDVAFCRGRSVRISAKS